MTHEPICDAEGRVLGVKALATRLRILEALERELAEKRYRAVAILRVAFRAGMSPAAFYQYFPDLETAVLALAALHQPMSPSAQRAINMIHAEDRTFGVTRPDQPDTRLELLATFIPSEGEWTVQDARQALETLGFELSAARCDELLCKLTDCGQLWPISATAWVRADPPPESDKALREALTC